MFCVTFNLYVRIDQTATVATCTLYLSWDLQPDAVLFSAAADR